MIDSTLIGKRNFLLCYEKARRESITVLNIKSGWKASGLWPVSVTKPLMSPLLLENSNKPTNQIIPELQEIPILPPEVSDTLIELRTPKSRREMCAQIRTLTNGLHD
jgi:hypothetical protein